MSNINQSGQGNKVIDSELHKKHETSYEFNEVCVRKLQSLDPYPHPWVQRQYEKLDLIDVPISPQSSF